MGEERQSVRFTYERFSDYFVAQQIIEGHTPDSIAELFVTDGPLSKLVSQGFLL